MNWKREAEEDLRKYTFMKNSLENTAERIKMLQNKAEAPHGGRIDSVPVHGGGTPAEDRLLNNIVERERLKATHIAAKRLVKLMEKGLSALDEKERRVIDLFYINKQKNHVERLMEEWSYEQRQIYNIKDKALYKYTISMYGLAEY